MLTLYTAPGTSALAAHILLEEVGAAYTVVDVADAQFDTSAYRKITPKGRVPALLTPHGVITENPAILEYIATTHANARYMPQGAMAQARARELAGYLCTTVHVAVAHAKRGARWADAAATHADFRAKAPRNMLACADYLESTLAFDPWALGRDFGFCDPYLFLMDHWCKATGCDLSNHPRLTAHHVAMRARPAVQRVLAFVERLETTHVT